MQSGISFYQAFKSLLNSDYTNVGTAASIVQLRPLSAGENRRVSACVIQKELSTPTPKSSAAFKDNCVIFEPNHKKAPVLWRECAGRVSVQPCPSRVMAVSEADETMQQSSLSHKPAKAP